MFTCASPQRPHSTTESLAHFHLMTSSSRGPVKILSRMFPRPVFSLSQYSTRFFASATSLSVPAAAAPAVLLVESPAKAKKIQEYLGSDYHVLASYGHIRDLPAKAGSVQPESNFAMRWELSDDAKPRIAKIAAAVASAPRIFLATDPDREGEAISWHLVEQLRKAGALPSNVSPQRITFTEVTKVAVEAALASPREVLMPLVEAYMARRALDYLFGFTLSPLLWRKLPGARSAGRVQSVALRMVTDREAAIESFNSQQYWTVQAAVDTCGESGGSSSSRILATLKSVDGVAPPKPGFLDELVAEGVRARVAEAFFAVASVDRRESARHPPPPFTTSTLQQEANRRFGMGSVRTMQLAQKLYEGGLITYMRTDGVFVAPHAVDALRQAVKKMYSADYLSEQPRAYSTRSKNAQEAHEAIRPTDPAVTSAALAELGFEPAAASLYSLIRARALASQMASARIMGVAADFKSSDSSLTLHATASHLIFPGFLAARGVIQAVKGAIKDGGEVEDEGGQEDGGFRGSSGVQFLTGEAAAAALDKLQQDAAVGVHDPEAAAHETRPPAPFTEGTLVKAMEEAGVGRPSTYAPTLKLLQTRRYVRKEGRALHAEPLGRVLSSFLAHHFPQYVDVGFSSQLEEDLDEVCAGNKKWREVLAAFWGPFHERVNELGSLTGTEVINALNEELEVLLFGRSMQVAPLVQQGGAEDMAAAGEAVSMEVPAPLTFFPRRACPTCGSPLTLKLSHRGGPFVGCSTFPQCSYHRPVTPEADVDPAVSEEALSVGEHSVGKLDEEDSVLIGMELAEKYGMRGSVRLVGRDGEGREIFARHGPFGPYLQLGADREHDMRRVPMPKGVMNMRSVTLEYALALLSLPRHLGNHPETGMPVEVRNGKFGPFVIYGRVKRSVPKEMNPLLLTMDAAMALLMLADRQVARKTAKAAAEGQPVVKKKRGRKARPKIEDIVADKVAGDVGTDGESEAAVKEEPPSGKKITRARSGFQFYLRDHIGDHKGVNPRERMKALSEAWRAVDAEVREMYDREVELDKQRYQLERTGLLQASGKAWEELSDANRAKMVAELKAKKGFAAIATGFVSELKRPRTPYTIFMHDMSEKFQREPPSLAEEGPKLPFIQRVATRWRSLSDDERRVYVRRAQEELEQYTSDKGKLVKNAMSITEV